MLIYIRYYMYILLIFDVESRFYEQATNCVSPLLWTIGCCSCFHYQNGCLEQILATTVYLNIGYLLMKGSLSVIDKCVKF